MWKSMLSTLERAWEQRNLEQNEQLCDGHLGPRAPAIQLSSTRTTYLKALKAIACCLIGIIISFTSQLSVDAIVRVFTESLRLKRNRLRSWWWIIARLLEERGHNSLTGWHNSALAGG